jgi:flagellum-specific peptidoglycan hydrolase FlgJ
VYDSLSQSIAAHINVLKRPAYQLAGAFTAQTPFAQALALQKAGYNTGPDREQYAAKLARIITSSGLQQFDQQLFAIEKIRNKNGLAYHEQTPITRTLHNIFG